MEIVWSIAIQNFVLVCTSLVLITMAIQRFKQSPRISLFTILVVSCAVSLLVFDLIERTAKIKGIMLLATICAVYGYVSRPACLFFMIMMTKYTFQRKFTFHLAIPLLVNLIVYLLAFIPGVKDYVFYFYAGDNGVLFFMGGPLRYSAHVVSAFYLAYLLVACIVSLQSKHISHSIALICCTIFITVAVIIETFFNDSNTISILYSTIGVSTLTYYLFIYIEKGSVDSLTGLFNRETYYRDIKDMHNTIRGVILFDMNGLKAINDEHDYDEGDKALITIGNAIAKCTPKSMYAYRLGADEFIVISNTCLEEELVYLIKKFKADIDTTNYSCAVGYSYSDSENRSFQKMLFEAEKRMAKEKEEFYQSLVEE